MQYVVAFSIKKEKKKNIFHFLVALYMRLWICEGPNSLTLFENSPTEYLSTAPSSSV